MRPFILSLAIFYFYCGIALAAEPMSTAPHVNPVPEEFGAGSQPLSGAMPPHFPEYLPNGAVNLDQAWIQDGGARYYWNTIIVPRQLKMAGAYWIDPALVPRLTTQPQKKAAPRRYYRRNVQTKRVSAKAPVNASSRALRTPAIPLPVEPVPGKSTIVPPPFSPSQTRSPVTPADTGIPMQPPRLQ